jgi:hypothetical protein
LKQAQLQHAQGIAYDDGALYIADTYNHRLRVLDLVAKQLGTAAGSERGWADGVAGGAKLDEPGGLSVADGKVYIADTNNQLIRVFDLATGKLSTLTLTNLSAITAGTPGRVTRVDLPAQSVSPAGTTIKVTLAGPASYHLNGSAPSRLELVSSNPTVIEPGERSVPFTSDEPSVTLPIPVRLAEGSAELTLTASVYYCRTGAEALCFIGQFELHVPVTVSSSATAGEIGVTYELPPA